MTSTIPRLVLRWLQSLDLSFSVRNARHDIANGYIIAEIFSRYYPHAVNTPLATNGTSLATKLDNWDQLEHFFRKNDIDVPRVAIDAVIHGHPGAAVMFLENSYMLLTGKNLARTSTLRPTTADYLSLASNGMIYTSDGGYQNAEMNISIGDAEVAGAGRGNGVTENQIRSGSHDYSKGGDSIIDHRSPADPGVERGEPDHVIENLNDSPSKPADALQKAHFSPPTSNVPPARPRARFQQLPVFPHYALPTTSKLIKSIPNSEIVMAKDSKGVKAKANAILETQKSASRHFRDAALQEGATTNNGRSTVKPRVAVSNQGPTCLKKRTTTTTATPASRHYLPSSVDVLPRRPSRIGGDADGGMRSLSLNAGDVMEAMPVRVRQMI